MTSPNISNLKAHPPRRFAFPLFSLRALDPQRPKMNPLDSINRWISSSSSGTFCTSSMIIKVLGLTFLSSSPRILGFWVYLTNCLLLKRLMYRALGKLCFRKKAFPTCLGPQRKKEFDMFFGILSNQSIRILKNRFKLKLHIKM